jgi:hypothetical protein
MGQWAMATLSAKTAQKGSMEKAIQARAKKLPARTMCVQVGFMEAKYPSGVYVAMVALIQELGAPRAGIPPRPFFKPMIEKYKGVWGATLGKLMKANKMDGRMSLDQLGEVIEGQLQDSIINVNSPALSPVTLMLRYMKSQDQSLVVNKTVVAEARARVARGESSGGVNAKPLDETGFMLHSIHHRIVEK